MPEKRKPGRVASPVKLASSSGPHKIPRIWVMVADRHVARVFSKRGNDISLVARMAPETKEAAFARKISDWLDAEVRKESFDRLVLVAAPHMLGELRRAISQHVYVRIVAEVNRDLTKTTDTELRRELGKILWF